jgi:hypothetical protein
MAGHQTPGRMRRALARVLDGGKLRQRLERLESELEGLQDSVHRESQRRDAEIAELRRQAAPHAMARSLSDDARRRGL